MNRDLGGSAAGGRYYADANAAGLLLDSVAHGAEMGSHLSGYGNPAGVSVNLLLMLEIEARSGDHGEQHDQRFGKLAHRTLSLHALRQRLHLQAAVVLAARLGIRQRAVGVVHGEIVYACIGVTLIGGVVGIEFRSETVGRLLIAFGLACGVRPSRSYNVFMPLLNSQLSTRAPVGIESTFKKHVKSINLLDFS